MIISLQRFNLPSQTSSQPIPTLSERQFIVSKSKLTSSEEQTQREMFWYREALLKCVKASWREVGSNRCSNYRYAQSSPMQPGSTRQGELSIRSQRLTRPMLEALRTAPCHVEFSLVTLEGTDVVKRGSHYVVPPHGFVYLRAAVRNDSGASKQLGIPLHLTIWNTIFRCPTRSHFESNSLDPHAPR